MIHLILAAAVLQAAPAITPAPGTTAAAIASVHAQEAPAPAHAQKALAHTQEAPDTSATVLTLAQALEIALSENASVRVADKEIEAKGYARKGTYASLFPAVNASGSFSRTLKKQVMSMDMGGQSVDIEVGRWNTFNGGVSANMPLVNAQLWKSIAISGQDVELAVEKARGSRLQMVTQVKQAYYAVLLAKEARNVYRSVYDNAVANCERTQQKYNASKASELDLARAKTAVANAIPNLYDSENAVYLTLWQLKALMGVDLDLNIDVAESLQDYAGDLQDMIPEDFDLSENSTLRQLEIQAGQLANTVRMQQYASLPSLALSFSASANAMENAFNFSEYKWHPYATVGLNLSIPIFSGGSRYHAVKQARAQQQEFDIQREDTERNLRVAIRQSLNTMETATKSYSSAIDALESAEKAYGIASKSYEVGRSTLTDLNDAQLALTQAQLAVSQAVYTFIGAKAALEQTIGADFSIYEK